MYNTLDTNEPGRHSQIQVTQELGGGRGIKVIKSFLYENGNTRSREAACRQAEEFVSRLSTKKNGMTKKIRRKEELRVKNLASPENVRRVRDLRREALRPPFRPMREAYKDQPILVRTQLMGIGGLCVLVVKWDPFKKGWVSFPGRLPIQPFSWCPIPDSYESIEH